MCRLHVYAMSISLQHAEQIQEKKTWPEATDQNSIAFNVLLQGSMAMVFIEHHLWRLNMRGRVVCALGIANNVINGQSEFPKPAFQYVQEMGCSMIRATPFAATEAAFAAAVFQGA
eukprot:5722499-Amphidinium_carterae.1